MVYNIDRSKLPRYLQNLPNSLRIFVEWERRTTPSEFADEILAKMIPPILLFGTEDRELRQEYTFEELSSNIPVALENLADIAKLDIPSLIQAFSEDNTAKMETIRVKANKNIKERFKEDWSQSGVNVSLVLKNNSLNVLIENESDQFTALAERSDGFRQFVALQSFAMKERAKEPILLIDEAELHLHYDAQADLIQMLSKQKVARQIIYTTHSAGCLPEDLGNGVRLVAVLEEDRACSKIVNRFWGSKESGFSPLLIGMGATTLAFFPTRRALVAEGEGEMLLLPTMLREALGRDVIGFQVVPGLSKSNKALFPSTGKNHIAYLVDGDAGGRSIKADLLRNSVPGESIFQLSNNTGIDCELEDFISIEILYTAANKLIEKFNIGKNLIKKPAGNIKQKLKMVSLAFKQSTGKPMSKVDLAYEILALVNDNPDKAILDRSLRGSFKIVSEKVEAFLTPGLRE